VDGPEKVPPGGVEAELGALRARVALLESQLGRRREGPIEREEFLRRAFEDAPIGMALVGLDERIREANASLCAMLGYSRDELLAKTVPEITHPDDRAVEAQPKGEMKAGQSLSFVVEKRYVRADGSTLLGRLSVTALHDEHLRPVWFLGQLEDVTRERAAEQARFTREQQFRALFDHAPDAYVLVGADGRVQGLNGPARLLFPDLSFADAVPEAIAAAVAQLLDARAVELPKVAELAIETPRGVVETEGRFARIPLSEGRGAMVALRDVTARRQAERALEAALADVSRTLSEREILLKEVHHRVKNNLQIISSLLAMQADGTDAATQSALRESVLRVRSMGLIHQLLYGSDNFASVDLARYAADLSSQVRATLDRDARVQVTAEPVRVPLETAIPVGLVLNELLTNALKHGRSADGVCRIEVRVRDSASDLVLEVSDEGPGLPPDFEARRRSSLGQRVMRALTGQLGGQLTHRSEHGAHFVLRVPKARS
jgi:PAS domain S-box-containing protein